MIILADGAWYLVGCSSWWSMLILAGGVQYLVGHGSWWGAGAGGAC